MGKFDDAIAAFEKAAALAPTQAAYPESLAVCHAVRKLKTLRHMYFLP